MITQDIRLEGVDGVRNFKSSEWGPDAAVKMCNKVRDFESPFVKEGTVGDILDKTLASGISKVMLEDKVKYRGDDNVDIKQSANHMLSLRTLKHGFQGKQFSSVTVNYERLSYQWAN